MEQQEKTEQALSAKESKAMKKEEKRKLKETKREQKAGKIGKKRKKAPVIIAAIIIILIVIRMVSCAFSGSAGVMVSTTNAFRGDIEENVSTSGKAVLFAPVGGRLNEVNVAAGDAVKAGDVLMTYDMDQMEERLQEATLQQTKSSASYNSTMTENSKSQAKLNEANTNLAVLDKQLADYKAYLKELQDKSKGRITIQAGSGVSAEVIRKLYPLTGIKAYHMTGKRVIDSEMKFRKKGVNMGLPMFSEYEIWRTEADNIRAAKKVLEEL